MEQVFRLFDFNVYNKNVGEAEASSGDSEEDGERKERLDTANFIMQIFGINEEGETCSILVNDYKPFFYVKVDDNWTMSTKDMFLVHLKNVMGNYYKNSIVECKLIKRKRLYGFDGGKDYKFVMLKFNNMNAFNKAKKLWFKEIQREDGTTELRLNSNGYRFAPTNTKTELYESNIPPLLRFFHIQEISPSGWVALPNKKTREVPRECKSTTCNYEFTISYKDIIPLKNKETRVPYKICSFDIEASSSHGDFPIPVKTYKKLAGNIVDYFAKLSMEITPELCKNILKRIMLTAFGFASAKDKMNEIDVVYPKTRVECTDKLNEMVDRLVLVRVRDNKNDAAQMEGSIESMFENMANATLEGGGDGEGEGGEGDGEGGASGSSSFYKKLNAKPKSALDKKATIVDILCNKKMERELKLQEVNQVLTFSKIFPPLEGDKVTFIGSTFVKYGEPEPYLNHCIALNTCDRIQASNTEIESYSTEKEVLLKWRDLIQKENPDIIIGYNIFGFDYSFMFQRAQECGCAEEFLKLSRNIDEVAASRDFTTNRLKIEESSISIASGTHELKYIKMNGRIQVDMYNFFRREENLTSYKLDYVAGHFIGDYVKTIAYDANTNKSKVQSGNLTGLLQDSFIHFEEIGHSTDYYKNGDKFKVLCVNKAEGWFEITGEEKPDMSKKVRWCLAKDDVSPKDIFRLTNGSSADRSIIAKYCIQDCNLVHYLFSKADVLTGLVEMSSICSVPMSFLIFRGQGIKLTSFVAKKCREKRTLMPVIEKGSMDEGYEGAIVLDPKCDLYLDNPVACVDFASLYPSAMMSENLSHDSKVWTKEYSLTGELVKIVGDRDRETGEFIYDNLPGYEYVNITYDTFKWVRKTPSSAAEKVKSGYKICRFAQFAEGRAIMPSILEELLQARKSTRKLIPQQTDDFMKNVLDKRQLAYKITANSLYGQCGAKTSTFYEKDIAASTTATGRLLLTYAKRMIEETYGDAVCNTKNHGPVLTKAEYIYGDSVANYTPTYVRANGQLDICTIESLAEKYGKNNWVKCVEEGKQEKEFCELENVETWTDKGWTKLHRIIRHELASHKKMVRVLTHTGLVDVTDDHSLLKPDGMEVSSKELKIGDELLHNKFDLNCKLKMYKQFEFTEKCEYLSTDWVYLAKLAFIANKSGFQFRLSTNNDNVICLTIQKNFENSKKIQKMHEIEYQGYVYDLTTDNHHFAAGIGNMIVHNTDSVFFTFNLQTPEGQPIRGKQALEITIELAQEAGHLASSFLKGPHDLEYEKTFMPFCLLSKKRYVGMLYEHDPNKGKRKEMGIVLKRRDNAPIVKDIYGGIIDILMKEQNMQKAIDFLKGCLQNIVDEKYPVDKLIISKSLNSNYKKPQQIAHKVLADRMASRDPGNKPTSGDRIPFVYIAGSKKDLQGDKIETPAFISANNLKIDYSFYITNQIMKPVQQLFALVLERIWEMQKKKTKIVKFKKEIEDLRNATDPEKFEDKLEKLRNKEVKALLFDDYLRKTNNAKEGNQAITSFWNKK